jgi:hypothetical protein
MVTVDVTAICDRCKKQEVHSIPLSQLKNPWWKPRDWLWMTATVGLDARSNVKTRAHALACSECQDMLGVNKPLNISIGSKSKAEG